MKSESDCTPTHARINPLHILITGGTGFIGRRLIAFLQGVVSAPSLTCLAARAANDREAEAEAEYRRAGIRIMSADIMRADLDALEAPPVGIVFHLAANIDTEGAASEHRVNDQGTMRLLDWLGPRLRGCRVVYASSVAVTDRSGPADGPLDENSPAGARTVYGMTKLAGEAIIRERSAAAGYTWTIVRLPTVYGPGQKPGGMFDLLRTQAAKGSLVARLDWPGRTSVLHVDDAVRVFWTLAGSPRAAGEIFYAASDESATVGEIARSIARATGVELKTVRLPSWGWAALRRLVWSRTLRAVVPRALKRAHWRLTLIVDDGFWVDATKLRAIYRDRLRTLDEGLVDTFVPQASGVSSSDTVARLQETRRTG